MLRKRYYAMRKPQAYSRRRYQRTRIQPSMAVVPMATEPPMTFVARTMGARAATERKYFDSYLTGTALVSANTWAGTELDPAGNCLFYPSEGSDIDNRIGRKVTVKSIKINGHLFADAQSAQAAADPGAKIRLILYVDTQTNATQAQGEQLMADPGAATSQLTINTFQSTANFGRFKVLKDKVFTMQNPNMAPLTDAGNTLVQCGMIRPFKIHYKFRKPIVVRFNATNGGSVADIIDNSFHLIGVTTGTGFTPVIHYQCRVVYTDN